jgi:hypothetical protein
MNWFLSLHPGGKSRAGQRAKATSSNRAKRSAARLRKPHLESLETRSLMAALPFGAMPDDTGEYMLGDVFVSVVLLESDPALSPSDNSPQPQGIGAPAEDWASNTLNTIAAVKQKVQDGLDYWEDTLDGVLAGTPSAGRDLLNFTVDWTFADNPLHTGYEPIARQSNDFVLWMYDFLNVVGFNQTGNFSSDIRAYNNFRREQSGSDWAFTIFVVNNEADQDKIFAPGGQFSKAFSFAGGRMVIVPADRPGSTFAHEIGHMFWGLDEYLGTTANYLTRRGYYNTPNTNHDGNPEEGFSQQDSIMANDPAREDAWVGKITSTSSAEMIGWRDSDGDGLFDVLDVPFILDGIGRYDEATQNYRFTGSSSVDTLPNRNSSGLQNDITINQIREVQVSIDGSTWTAIQTLPQRTYQTGIDVAIPLTPGEHTIKIRTIDTRTGAMSPEFVGTTSMPTQTPSPGGVSGFVYRDDDSDGTWDPGEPPLPDWALDLVDEFGVELDLLRRIEPNQYAEFALLNNVHSEALLSAVGSEVANTQVRAKSTTPATSAGRVFANNSVILGNNVVIWNASRQLRIDFTNPVSSLSLKAYGTSGASVGRLEIYNGQGELLDRYTTSALGNGNFETMNLRRAQGDIAYAVAYGHAGTDVMLDTLQWGPFASATTNTLGAYSISSLPGGTYRIRINPPPRHYVTTYPTNVATVGLAAGESVGNINFGITTDPNPWHLLAKPLNVNADAAGDISPIDALLVINWLNAHPNDPSLPAQATPQIHGYIDVNNDGFVSPLDALLVINWLNAASAPPIGLMAAGGPSGFAVAPSASGPAEGEQSPLLPAQSAAEYYARNPLHFSHIAGDDELCLHDHGDEDHDHEALEGSLAAQPLQLFSTGGLGSVPLFVFGSASFDSLRTIADKLPSRVEPVLAEQLLEKVLLPVLDHIDEVAAALARAEEELDEALDAIAPEVAETWHAAVDRILRRLSGELG